MPPVQTNGRCADFFVLHNFVQPRTASSRVLAYFDRVASEYPHWNATTRRLGPARHLLISPCDHGPADCMYDRESRPVDYLDARPGAAVRWRDLDYRSASRRVAILNFNGFLGEVNHFKRGLDIRLPAFDDHQCGKPAAASTPGLPRLCLTGPRAIRAVEGPLCGMPHSDLARGAPRARAVLRRLSPWAASAANAALSPPTLDGRRRYRLFFAGRATLHGPRGGLFRHHRQRPGYLLHDTSGRFAPIGEAAAANTSDDAFFAKAMARAACPSTDPCTPRARREAREWAAEMRRGSRACIPPSRACVQASSDFCFAPLGQSDGDSDRYLPAVLYGCVPVFGPYDEAKPLEEARGATHGSHARPSSRRLATRSMPRGAARVPRGGRSCLGRTSLSRSPPRPTRRAERCGRRCRRYSTA